jgi:hypothetical protein
MTGGQEPLYTSGPAVVATTGGQEPLHTIKRLKRLKGLVVRNLVHAVGLPPSSAGSAGAGAPHSQPRASSSAGCAVPGDSDGGCFFSVHPVESSSGKPSDTCVYVSTLCKERCNPSWSDVEPEDMCLTWMCDWEHHRMGIRIWIASRRPPGAQGKHEPRSNDSPNNRPSPRVALWERGKMIWQRAEAGTLAPDDLGGGTGGGLETDAGIPEWVRRGDPFSAGSEVGRARHGGLLGGGWVDSYRCNPDAFCRREYDVEMALEIVVVWSDWVLMETPLAHLAAAMPANAVFMTLADAASSCLRTYVDETNPSMAKLLKPNMPAVDVAPGADSDSERALRGEEAASIPDGTNAADVMAGAARSEAALKAEKEREERQRRKDAEREREKQQRSLLLGSKDSRTPGANRGAALWGAGLGGGKDGAITDARRDGDGTRGAADGGRAARAVGVGGVGGVGGGGGGGGEGEGGIPHKCRLRAKALEARRAGVEERRREAALVKARLEGMLAMHAKREQEEHRHKEMKVRLNQLRRRVQEEEAVLEDLKNSIAKQERRLEEASCKDTQKAAQTLQARALAVLDMQAQRSKTSSQEAARAMGIEFALPPSAADCSSMGASSSMEDAMARHAQVSIEIEDRDKSDLV